MNSSPLLQSSTGLASGNHLLEATTHGLCEVIERDAEALWVQRKENVRVDIATVDDPSCRHVLSLLERAKVHVGVWDITSDIGIPAYACVIMDQPDSAAWRVHGAYSGFGCHLAPAIGLLRALTEAVQSRLTFIAGSRDDMFRRDYISLQLDEAQHIRWRELCDPVRLRSFSQRSSLATDTFEGDVSTILDRLQEVGVNSAVIINLTKPEFAIPVVKVMVPSLEESGEDNRPGERIKSMREQCQV